MPETIAMRFTEEDAGYVTVRPVVRQVFRRGELIDMVLSVTGKNVQRVQQILRAGTIVYNGYRYWWDGFASQVNELDALLALFPDDDPSRVFDPGEASTITIEIGGGTQRSFLGITRQEASAKRFFRSSSPWEILIDAARVSSPRYEKYSHAQRADLYRLHLTPEAALGLRNEILDAAPRAMRKKLAGLQPPSALLFYIPRAHSANVGSPP